MKKYVIVGCGSRGSGAYAMPLIRKYADCAQLCGVYDTNRKRAELIASESGADIPVYDNFDKMLEDDVLLSLDYLIWQHYWNASPDSFLENYMRASHPEIHDDMLRKSIITGDFEEASRKHYFLEQTYWTPSCGVEVAGFGAYHIEYDYPDASAEEAEEYGLQSGVDYPWVRKAIKNLNPQIKK